MKNIISSPPLKNKSARRKLSRRSLPSLSVRAPRSLYTRFLLITILPLLLIQGVTTLIFFENHWDSLSRNMSNSLAGEVTLISNGIENINSEEREYIFTAAKQYLGFDAYVMPEDGINPEGNVNDQQQTFVNSLKNRMDKEFYLFPHGGDYFRLAILLDDGVLNIVFSDKRIASPSITIFLLWVAGSAVVLILIAVLFLRGQVRSILSLSKAAENFGKGDEIEGFKPAGAKEIRMAGVAFIEMRERIKRLLDTRTQMLAGVSHDLKTPLTRMKLITAVMDDKDKAMQLEQEVDEMNKMIEGYIRFTQLDSHDHLLESLAVVDLADYMQKIIYKFQNYDTRIELNIPRGLECKIRPEYFARSVINLIDNATRYAKNILVRAQGEDNKFIHIFIDDDGEGIPEDKLEEVFQPFNRIDESRNSETGGTGLGLSIARDIVHKHGGEIVLSRSHLGGLKVHITLPL